MPQTFSIDYPDTRVANRKIDELMGLCRAMVSDGELDKREADLLFDWFEANRRTTQAPLVNRLFEDLDEIYSTGRGQVDPVARQKLVDKMTRFAGADLGGASLMPTSLPLDEDPEPVEFEGKRFCFTGTFEFGTRRKCHEAVWALGGEAGEVRTSTDYLVIGAKATASWRHASYGRKIVQAVEWQEKGHPIHIISEYHWVKHLSADARDASDDLAHDTIDPASDQKRRQRKPSGEAVHKADAPHFSVSAFRSASRSSNFGTRVWKPSKPRATSLEGEEESKQQISIIPLMILAASLSAIVFYTFLKPESAQSATLALASTEAAALCSAEVSFQLPTCSFHPSGRPAS